MKKLPFTILVLICLAFVGWMLWRGQKNEQWQEGHGAGEAQTLLPADFDAEQLVRVEIHHPAGENFTLVRTEAGEWGMQERQGYPVNLPQLRVLLSDLMNARIVRAFSGEEATSLGLTEEAVELHFVLDNQRRMIWRFGAKSQPNHDGSTSTYDTAGHGMGRYVQRLLGEGAALERPLQLSNTFSLLDDAAGEWLDTLHFLRVEKLKTISLYVEEKEEWKFSRTAEKELLVLQGTIEQGKELDAQKAARLPMLFRWVRFIDVRPMVAAGDKKEKYRLELEDFEGRHWTISWTPDTGSEGSFVRVSTTDSLERHPEEGAELWNRWQYLIPWQLVNHLPLQRQDFLKAKTVPPAQNIPPVLPAQRIPKTIQPVPVPENR